MALKNEIFMTQEEFDKAPLLDQILYDETGMLVENHPSIAEAMEKYHQAKLKLLGIGGVSDSRLPTVKDAERYFYQKHHFDENGNVKEEYISDGDDIIIQLILGFNRNFYSR